MRRRKLKPGSQLAARGRGRPLLPLRGGWSRCHSCLQPSANCGLKEVGDVAIDLGLGRRAVRCLGGCLDLCCPHYHGGWISGVLWAQGAKCRMKAITKPLNWEGRAHWEEQGEERDRDRGKESPVSKWAPQLKSKAGEAANRTKT